MAVGLSRRPNHAKAFYSTLILAFILGMGFTPIDPIEALYWSAVINGVVAVPIMTVTMMMTANEGILGEFKITGWLRLLRWGSTAAMAASVLGMAITWFA
ncbi:Natural resistance-associated macrophage protein [Rhizobium tibeticum]|uniref:Natural resistance-associated macrophage protein n=1 Tax=Rhizobium tibeticum TaxID=501024 RepID=A0A1H8L9D0_9HYPH|nr:Natural resistance-associated macrophage protein [Rhizobium tibeticum]SEO01701.1 Natural resistance-associated macrophage protein [Rhizobium tibeticum]